MPMMMLLLVFSWGVDQEGAQRLVQRQGRGGGGG
jgi:hypothetical protein